MTETTVTIDLGERSYPIHIGRGLLGQSELLNAALAGSQVLLVSDQNVAPHYLETVVDGLAPNRVETLILEPGEATKSVSNWQRILDQLVAMGAQRDVTLVALGGGVIGDLTGFAAASYMRGVQFIQIPTSLLAQVDASVGGKTAINHVGGKNLIGAFYQPAAVLIDTDTQRTLPEREYLAGLAEVIKMGLIADADFVTLLEADLPLLLARDESALQRAIEKSVRHKARVVALDEREAGNRALLNLGHTFGHAIETLTGYETVLHGEAVAIGMVLAAQLSVQLGRLPAPAAKRITALLEATGLPTSVPKGLTPQAMLEVMRLDKKNRAGQIRLVLLDDIGAARLVDDVSEAAIDQALSAHAAG